MSARPVRAALLRQARNNSETAGHWELYDGHRRRLSDTISVALAEGGGGRLCILGAGNGNDLDLARLRAQAGEIHLVDLDVAALRRAAARNAGPGAPLRVHGPFDASGLLAWTSRWRRSPPAPAARHQALAAAGAAARALPGPFDVVVSDCLLSQILHSCFTGIGRVPWLQQVLDLAVSAHLALLLALAGENGRVVLATDVLSSETFPLEERFAEGDPVELLHALSREGRLFTGINPPALRAALRELRPRGAPPPRLEGPWLWRQARASTLLVCALTFVLAGGITREG